MCPPLLFEALRVTCLHVVLEHVNGSSLTFFIILVSVQRSEESFRYIRTSSLFALDQVTLTSELFILSLGGIVHTKS